MINRFRVKDSNDSNKTYVVHHQMYRIQYSSMICDKIHQHQVDDLNYNMASDNDVQIHIVFVDFLEFRLKMVYHLLSESR